MASSSTRTVDDIINKSWLFNSPKTPPRSPRSDSSDSDTQDLSSIFADDEDREEASSSNPITASFNSLKNSLLTGPFTMTARSWFDDLTAFILGAEYKPTPLEVAEDDVVQTPIGNYVRFGQDWVPLSKTWDKPWENRQKRLGYIEDGGGKPYEVLLPTNKDIDFIELKSFRLPVNQMHRQYKHTPYSNYGGKINIRDEGKPGYLKRKRNAGLKDKFGDEIRSANKPMLNAKQMKYVPGKSG